ncbi:hypothetical protein Gogos_001536 [Gossypium gossypioides]|uniref:tRNA-intron lyase n=1 Tax=Gossypium gossypioides TaxID=34282 RepID=A0A7J9CWG0_GOSGO|nr:hypothetical protein [Gossypium gossypioides]
MKPRCKGKGSEAKASADPMSKIVSQLHSSLIRSEPRGLLLSRNVLIEADAELSYLFNRARFGQSRITSQEEKQWFQLEMEEAFYLCFSLECLKVIGKDGSIKRLQYGVDFIAYRHLPALIHSEYAVLALSKGDNELNGRLRVWSDVHCTVCLCGSVAKTLLVLFVDSNSQGTSSPSCLEHYTVEEETITRWNPEQSREDETSLRNQT